MRLAVALQAVTLVLLLGFTWLLVNSMLEGDSNYLIRGLYSVVIQEEPTPEPPLDKYKCGMSAPCPPKHLAFRLTSGAANVIGPKICVDDKNTKGDILKNVEEGKSYRFKMTRDLVSSARNNIGRGLNIALVNGVTGDVLGTKSFDMWAGDVSDLLKYLQPLHEGTLVFVASFDDPASKLNDEARQLFEELGSASARELSARDSWVFVGTKGIQNKSPFEHRMKNSTDTNKYNGWPEPLEMDGCVPLRAPLESSRRNDLKHKGKKKKI